MKKRERFDERLHAYLNGNLETEYLYEYPLDFEEKEAPYAEVYGKLSKLPNTISQMTSKRIHEMIRQKTSQNPQMCHILHRIKSYQENLTIKQKADPLLQKSSKIDIVEVLADHKDIIRGKRWVNKFPGQQQLEMATDNLNFGHKDFNRNSYMCSGYTKPKIAHPSNKPTVAKDQAPPSHPMVETPKSKPKTSCRDKTANHPHKFRVSKGTSKQAIPHAAKPNNDSPPNIHRRPNNSATSDSSKSNNSINPDPKTRRTISRDPPIPRPSEKNIATSRTTNQPPLRKLTKRRGLTLTDPQEPINGKKSEEKIGIKNFDGVIEGLRPKDPRKHSFYIDQLMSKSRGMGAGEGFLEIKGGGSNQGLIGEFCYSNFGECNGVEGVGTLREANRSVLKFYEDRNDGSEDYIKIKGGHGEGGLGHGEGILESASSVDSLEAKKFVGGRTTKAGVKSTADWMKFSKGFTLKAPKITPSENLSFGNKATPRNQTGATDSLGKSKRSSTMRAFEQKIHFSPPKVNVNMEQNSREGFIPLAPTAKTPELKFVREKSDKSFMALDKKSQLRNSKSSQDLTPDSKGSG